MVSAVPFLRIVADARSGAMGDAGIGISPDPNAMHFNPSKIVLRKKGLPFPLPPRWLPGTGLNDVYLAYLTGLLQTG